MKIFAIVACTKDGGIGKNGQLPWPHMKEDMKNFMTLTKGPGKAVVMGRKTWDSLPERHRPLKDRVNIVISKTIEPDGCVVLNHPQLAIQYCLLNNIDEIWFLGGASIFDSLFDGGISVDRVYLTLFNHEDPECDTHFNLSRLYSRYVEEHMLGPFTQDGFTYKISELSDRKKR